MKNGYPAIRWVNFQLALVGQFYIGGNRIDLVSWFDSTSPKLRMDGAQLLEVTLIASLIYFCFSFAKNR